MLLHPSTKYYLYFDRARAEVGMFRIMLYVS